MKKTYRIDSRDLKKVDPKLSSQYQGAKKFDYELGNIKAILVRKYDDRVTVDIEYEEIKE
ncbi:hypothetical protein KBC79_01445 [Candidatus Woesebacteria bacterium]|nr:hypothetical protein [Candidatus Woesebacteria bacterium]